MINFMPGGSVTGIGSLPHLDATDAVRFVAQFCPEIPFWPQLPQRSVEDNMLLQMLAPLADLLEYRSPARIELASDKLAEFCRRLVAAPATLDERHASGFFAFERACQAHAFPHARAFKGQIYGPLTLARCLYTAGRPFATIRTLQKALTAYLCRLAQWQIRRLHGLGKPVILFIDEPALALESPDGSGLNNLRMMIQVIRKAGAFAGLHCCAANEPTLLCAAQPDMISFDAYHSMETFLTAPLLLGYILKERAPFTL